ncbi:potassium transporter Kup [Azospirillum tabaci]|uniref:potassium transporter Kup n=1 Tax=Azospirillum tabaci TaxID=2752310 RepID=UPI001FE60917|nr:potassium transporter Kup [Azospirillum tabaci]
MRSTPTEKAESAMTRERLHNRTGSDQGSPGAALLLGALGIVYGDIGTSPLYTLREIFIQGGITPDRTHVLGALSLIFWTVLLVVTVKYVIFVMRADNKGEGGVLALTALALRRRQGGVRSATILTLGILGAALFYGDAVITPAISVLGAIEGLKVASPALMTWVLPLTLTVLAALFAVQRFGTAGVGRMFGPVMLVWFLTLALLGAAQIVVTPVVLSAISPHHAILFLAEQGWTGLLVFGAVVLCVTGAEALYADMGHFGREPIRKVWFALVWPALILNYFGQGGLLIAHPEAIENPFYLLAPDWALIPLLLLATAAAVIAAQAVISGAFSLANQAVRLGYLPRLQVLHTSEAEIGQVYVPALNWLMLASVIALVLGFGSSTNLAAAYGIAVTGTMIVTTLLGYEVARRYGRMGKHLALLLVAGFLSMDLAFFGANLLKVLHGGWVPLLIAGLVWFMISTWIRGRATLHQRRFQDALPVADLLSRSERLPVRTARTAVYMTRDLTTVPAALLHNLKHNMVLHERVILMKVDVEEEPRVAEEERVTVERLGKGFHTVLARYGFMEDPDVPAMLQACRSQGLAIEPMEVSYFLSRETLIPSKNPALPRSREHVFIMLHALSGDATRFFKLPPGQVVELGTQIEI